MALDVMFFENHINKLAAYANSIGLRLRWVNEPMTLSLRWESLSEAFRSLLRRRRLSGALVA